ncbi:MAG: metal ABC transporter permease [Planctomycetota bacterium]
MLTTLLTQWIHSFGRVEASAAMGVVFTALFAVGLIMIEHVEGVDLDASCVLYGAIEFAPFQMIDAFGYQVPRAVVTLTPMVLIGAGFVLLFYKELKLASFDPALATTLGVNATLMHYLLMTLVAATTVAAFESVGSIMVIAMLIVPPAAAYLLTDRLSVMIALSLVIATASAVLGAIGAQTVPYWLGHHTDTNTSGMMATCAGLLFVGAWVFSPRQGLISRSLNRFRLSQRILREDILGLLYRFEELAQPQTPHMGDAALAEALFTSGWQRRLAISRLSSHGLIERRDDAYELTVSGRRNASRLVRAHRLWETYLHKHLNLPEDHLHPSAHQLEHVTDAEMRLALEQKMDRPGVDPHHSPIPPEAEDTL